MTKTTPHLGIEEMPDHCCEVDCINSSSKRKGTRFFGFPLKDKKDVQDGYNDHLVMLPNSMGRDFSYHPRTAYDFDLNMDHLVLLDFKALISECRDFD